MEKECIDRRYPLRACRSVARSMAIRVLMVGSRVALFPLSCVGVFTREERKFSSVKNFNEKGKFSFNSAPY